MIIFNLEYEYLQSEEQCITASTFKLNENPKSSTITSKKTKSSRLPSVFINSLYYFRTTPRSTKMSDKANGSIIQLEDGWNNEIKKRVRSLDYGVLAALTESFRLVDHDWRVPRISVLLCGRVLFKLWFYFKLVLTATSLLSITPFPFQAIDKLEQTLDNGFDTAFEPKEYIRIYT